jgi:hypothetical protein
MSQGYSAMTRVFSRGSNGEIVGQLGSFFKELEHVTRQEEYDTAHAAFCRWFERSITMAGKTERGCSYGHAAKVLDIAAKVYVYYCAQPSPEAAEKLIPMLHGGLDTAMIDYLGGEYPPKGIRARNVVGIDLDEYSRLQESVAEDIRSRLDSQIHPVQWNDILEMGTVTNNPFSGKRGYLLLSPFPGGVGKTFARSGAGTTTTCSGAGRRAKRFGRALA